MENKIYYCPKCGEVEVSSEGAYCDECKGSFDDRCNMVRAALASVEETGDPIEDFRRRRDALNSLHR